MHWDDLPIRTLRRLHSVLITGIAVVCLPENPAFNKVKTTKMSPRLALLQDGKGGKELLGRNLVIADLERRMHQKWSLKMIKKSTLSLIT